MDGRGERAVSQSTQCPRPGPVFRPSLFLSFTFSTFAITVSPCKSVGRHALNKAPAHILKATYFTTLESSPRTFPGGPPFPAHAKAQIVIEQAKRTEGRRGDNKQRGKSQGLSHGHGPPRLKLADLIAVRKQVGSVRCQHTYSFCFLTKQKEI